MEQNQNSDSLKQKEVFWHVETPKPNLSVSIQLCPVLSYPGIGQPLLPKTQTLVLLTAGFFESFWEIKIQEAHAEN